MCLCVLLNILEIQKKLFVGSPFLEFSISGFPEIFRFGDFPLIGLEKYLCVSFRQKEKLKEIRMDVRPVYYKDGSGDVQGPFHPGQMHNWWKQGHLQDSLMIRIGADEAFESLESRLLKTADPFGVQALVAKAMAETKERNEKVWMNEVRRWVSAKGWENDADPVVTKSAEVVKKIASYPLEGCEKEEEEVETE